jgi:hypothetical protein
MKHDSYEEFTALVKAASAFLVGCFYLLIAKWVLISRDGPQWGKVILDWATPASPMLVHNVVGFMVALTIAITTICVGAMLLWFLFVPRKSREEVMRDARKDREEEWFTKRDQERIEKRLGRRR